MPDLGTIIVPQFDKDRWMIQRKRGRVFECDGRRVELFPLSVLARAIGKTEQSIKLWEKAGKFPRPMFTVPIQKKITRWYSKEQIANIRALYKQYPKKSDHAKFLKAVWKVFYNLERVIEGGGDVQ